MANNPYVNKVVYGNNTVMDISDTTAEEADVASGAVFYKASGARSVGTGSTSGGVSEDLLKDTVGWVGKNLADFTDGKGINTSGVVVDDANRIATINPIIIDSGVTYKYITAIASGSKPDCIYAVWNNDTLVRRVAGITTGTELDTSGGNKLYVCAYLGSSTVTVDSAKAMVVKASVTDDTYEPYHESVEEELEKKTISLTKAQYDALPSDDKNDPDKVYYVTDYDPDDDSTVVQVPSFYVELSVAPTEQTPIVVPDGTLSKPFRLILRNVGSSNINIGAGSSAVFMKEQTSATVKSIYTTYRISSYSYSNGSTSVRIYPASSTSQTYPSIADLTYDPKVEKLIFAYTKTYNEYDFLSVKQKGSEIDSTTAVDIYTSKDESIIIFAREYNKSTGVYRGHHTYFVFTPNVESPVPQSVSMGASSNTGINITFANEDESTGKVTIKASSSSYYVDYTAYRVCN